MFYGTTASLGVAVPTDEYAGKAKHQEEWRANKMKACKNSKFPVIRLFVDVRVHVWCIRHVLLKVETL